MSHGKQQHKQHRRGKAETLKRPRFASSMATHSHRKHSDHDYITARIERYISDYEETGAQAVIKWMDPKGFVYSNFGGGRGPMNQDEVKEAFNVTFGDFHDLDIKTLSLHGHKDFTTWEWEMTYKLAFSPGDKTKRLTVEEAPLVKTVGCTLMWWNGEDKIVKQHDYVPVQEV